MQHPLAHPGIKGIPVGTSAWFVAQQKMIRSKPLVKRCYDLWYRYLLADADSVPPQYRAGRIVELGSGSSYIKEHRPDVITSDVTPGVADLVIDGRTLPFPDQSVRALFLTHVFHHIPDVRLFLAEADRVLVPGGVISIVDIPHTRFARFFFTRFHPEPFDDQAAEWSFPEGDSMLDSNQALTWIVFWRDRNLFRRLFPSLRLERMRYLPWLSYLLSGGVNLRSFVPRPLTWMMPAVDWLLKPLDLLFAIHWHLTIRKAIPNPIDRERKALESEAAFFHQAFFRSRPPAAVVERYVAANLHCFGQLDETTRGMIDTIVSRRLDAEAIELVLRARHGAHPLTRKLQVLFYLVEVRSDYFERFINCTPGLWRTLPRLFGALLRTVWKYGKGYFLIWRFGLA